ADVMNPILRQKGIRSLLGVPILFEGKVIGVLHVGTLKRRLFDRHDAQLLQIVADRIGLGIEYARLYQEAQETSRLKDEFLATVIEAAIDAMRPAASARNIRVETRLDPRIDLIQGDPDRLQQVMWNLLSNAIKFTPEGGRVDVVLERVDSHFELTVRDTGKGIRSEFLPHLFERFRQADASATRALGGLGLGLAIARHLVELHGGTVEAESAGEGKGATFRVRIPLRVATEDTRAHEAREGSASRSEEHTSELQSPCNLVCRLLLEKKKQTCTYS